MKKKSIISIMLAAAISAASAVSGMVTLAENTNPNRLNNGECYGQDGSVYWWGTHADEEGAVISYSVTLQEEDGNSFARCSNRTESGAAQSIFQWLNYTEEDKNKGNEDLRPKSGKNYDISFRARISPDATAKPTGEKIMLALNGDVLCEGILTENWVMFTGTSKIKNVGECNSYRIYTDGTVDFDVDDIFVRLNENEKEVTYGEIIQNGDFEGGNTDGWWGFGAVTIETLPADAKHNSPYAKISGREADWAGMGQNTTAIVGGQKYSVKADVAADAADGAETTSVNIMITYTDVSGNAQYIQAGTAEVRNGEWGAIDSDFTLPEDIPNEITIYINSANQGDTIYADNISIKAVKPNSVAYKNVGEHNPLMTHRFGADPFAMEYDGRLYIYMSSDAYPHDENGELLLDENGGLQGNNYGNINSITVISTDDMVNWTDHGRIPVGARNSAPEAEPNGAAQWATNSWAPSAVHKTIDGKEKFFLYFADNGSGIGVLEADSPTGPFTDPIGESLVALGKTEGTEGVQWCFDPAVFIDDDGQAYMYFGGGDRAGDGMENNPKTARVIKLGDDMISTVGEAVEIDAPGIFEDSGIHKYNGKYYYSYSTNWGCTNLPTVSIAYMTSDNPMGPFEYKGIALKSMWDYFQYGGNNHHAIFEYNNQWYITYHSEILDRDIMGSNHGYRSAHINKLEYNDAGTIKTATADREGVEQIKDFNPYKKTEAETIAWNAGIETANLGDTYNGNMKLTSIDDGDWTSLSSVNFGDDGAAAFKAVVKSDKGGKINIRLDSPTGAIAGTLNIPAGINGFEELSVNLPEAIKGKYNVFFTFEGDGEDLFEVDYWNFAKDASETVFKVDEPQLVGSEAVIKVTNTTSEDRNIFVYVASYNEGVLTNVTKTERTSEADSGEIEIKASAQAGDVVYVWDNMMSPYTDKKTL